MSGIGWKNPLAAMVALAALVGCGTTPETMQSDTNQITLRWFKYGNSFDDAQRVAAAHCGSFAKRQQLMDDRTDRDVEIARFACR
jgi:hypothetical protein